MSEQDAAERRAIDVGMLIAKIEQLHEDLLLLDGKITAHISQEITDIENAVKKAFNVSMPNGDPLLHQQIHDTDIQLIKDRKEFWKKLLFEISKTGLLGLLVWIAYALWGALLAGPPK